MGRSAPGTLYRTFRKASIMGQRHHVIGRTGSIVLSDEKIQYKISQKRTARYLYMRCLSGHLAIVVGPFHSALYGACSFGTKRTSAKKALVRRLANDYGYIGTLMFTKVDEADNVGIVNPRLLDYETVARPITRYELCGSAGQ